MSNPNEPRVSVLAMAKRSADYATTAFTIDDVRRIRPAWDGPECRHFLDRHEAELAHAVLEVGRAVLERLIESHEREAGNG